MLRTWLKRPGLSAAVIVTLALGLGATIGIFSVANAVLFRPLGPAIAGETLKPSPA